MNSNAINPYCPSKKKIKKQKNIFLCYKFFNKKHVLINNEYCNKNAEKTGLISIMYNIYLGDLKMLTEVVEKDVLKQTSVTQMLW